MKIKDLPIGTIFTVPTMPQRGIMMLSLLRGTEHEKLIVSLSGNCWSHRINTVLDDDLEVEVLDEVKKMLQHIKRSVIIEYYSS